MKTVKTTTVAAALGMVIAGSTVAAEAQASAFGFQAMEAGYQLVGNEGKCGEGKCGDKKAKEAEHKGREVNAAKASVAKDEESCRRQMW